MRLAFQALLFSAALGSASALAAERILPNDFPQKGDGWADPLPKPISHADMGGYPVFAELLEISGSATIIFLIDAEGNVQRPLIQSSQPAGIFESACLDFVRSFKYAPQTRAGSYGPVTRRWSYTCRFALE